jgi:hypothetical protein
MNTISGSSEGRMSRSASAIVVANVAGHERVDPTALETALCEAVDPDAIDGVDGDTSHPAHRRSESSGRPVAVESGVEVRTSADSAE